MKQVITVSHVLMFLPDGGPTRRESHGNGSVGQGL